MTPTFSCVWCGMTTSWLWSWHLTLTRHRRPQFQAVRSMTRKVSTNLFCSWGRYPLGQLCTLHCPFRVHLFMLLVNNHLVVFFLSNSRFSLDEQFCEQFYIILSIVNCIYPEFRFSFFLFLPSAFLAFSVNFSADNLLMNSNVGWEYGVAANALVTCCCLKSVEFLVHPCRGPWASTRTFDCECGST